MDLVYYMLEFLAAMALFNIVYLNVSGIKPIVDNCISTLRGSNVELTTSITNPNQSYIFASKSAIVPSEEIVLMGRMSNCEAFEYRIITKFPLISVQKKLINSFRKILASDVDLLLIKKGVLETEYTYGTLANETPEQIPVKNSESLSAMLSDLNNHQTLVGIKISKFQNGSLLKSYYYEGKVASDLPFLKTIHPANADCLYMSFDDQHGPFSYFHNYSGVFDINYPALVPTNHTDLELANKVFNFTSWTNDELRLHLGCLPDSKIDAFLWFRILGLREKKYQLAEIIQKIAIWLIDHPAEAKGFRFSGAHDGRFYIGWDGQSKVNATNNVRWILMFILQDSIPTTVTATRKEHLYLFDDFAKIGLFFHAKKSSTDKMYVINDAVNSCKECFDLAKTKDIELNGMDFGIDRMFSIQNKRKPIALEDEYKVSFEDLSFESVSYLLLALADQWMIKRTSVYCTKVASINAKFDAESSKYCLVIGFAYLEDEEASQLIANVRTEVGYLLSEFDIVIGEIIHEYIHRSNASLDLFGSSSLSDDQSSPVIEALLLAPIKRNSTEIRAETLLDRHLKTLSDHQFEVMLKQFKRSLNYPEDLADFFIWKATAFSNGVKFAGNNFDSLFEGLLEMVQRYIFEGFEKEQQGSFTFLVQANNCIGLNQEMSSASAQTMLTGASPMGQIKNYVEILRKLVEEADLIGSIISLSLNIYTPSTACRYPQLSIEMSYLGKSSLDLQSVLE